MDFVEFSQHCYDAIDHGDVVVDTFKIFGKNVEGNSATSHEDEE